MAIQINPFGAITLTESVNQLKPVPSFLRNLLFKRKNNFATTSVLVDIKTAPEKVSALVKRGNPAKVVENLGQKAIQIEPPQLRDKKFLRPSDLYYTRGADAPVFVPGGQPGNDPIMQMRKKKIGEEQRDLHDRQERTVERLIALGLAGSYSIAQDDGTYSIDFSMPAANKPSLTTTAKWDAPDTCTPLKNIRQWKLVAKKASGKIPNHCVMNSNTFEYWLAAAEVKEYLDLKNVNLGSVETAQDIIDAGAEYKGSIDGEKYYTYDAVYTDDNGVQQFMIPDGYVALLSPAGDHRLLYAGIEDLEAGNVVADYFSKDWIEKDPSGLWLLVESHPLPAFLEPAANIYAKVY